MDEILASIRRIISEGDATAATVMPVPPAQPTALAAVDDDVLVLTERAPPEPAPPPAPTAPPPTATQAAEAPTANAQPAPAEPLASDKPMASSNPAPAAAPAGALVTKETALTAAASFEKLASLVESQSLAVPANLAVTPAGPTLEDLTRDLLRPLVKVWLDENLAGIVQAAVEVEVERISRGRR